jgi:hypothetical protein
MPSCNQHCCKEQQEQNKQSSKRSRKRAARKVRRREAYWAATPLFATYRDIPGYALPYGGYNMFENTREQFDNWLAGRIAHPLLIALLTRDLTFIVDSFLGYDHRPTFRNSRCFPPGEPILLPEITNFPTFIVGHYLRDPRPFLHRTPLPNSPTNPRPYLHR